MGQDDRRPSGHPSGRTAHRPRRLTRALHPSCRPRRRRRPGPHRRRSRSPPPTTRMVRVLHGSPDAPSVDVFVNDGKVDALSGLEFGKITDYVKVPAGTYAIKVCATADNTVCPIGPVDLDLRGRQEVHHRRLRPPRARSRPTSSLTADAKSRRGQGPRRPPVRRHPRGRRPDPGRLRQGRRRTWPTRTPPATSSSPPAATTSRSAPPPTTPCARSIPGALALKSGVAYSVFADRRRSQPAEGAAALTAVVAVDGTAVKAPAHRHHSHLLERLGCSSSRAQASLASWPPAAS